jgi:large repetitive protein
MKNILLTKQIKKNIPGSLLVILLILLTTAGMSFGQVSFSIKKNGPTTASPGEEITYTIAYSSTGAQLANNAIITDFLPAAAEYTYVSSFPEGIYNSTNNTLSWGPDEIADLLLLGSGTRYITITIKAGKTGTSPTQSTQGYYMSNYTNPVSLLNYATIKSDEVTAPIESNIVTTIVTTRCSVVMNEPSSGVKSASGSSLTYLMAITNTGNIYQKYTLTSAHVSGRDVLIRLIQTTTGSNLTETPFLAPGETYFFHYVVNTPNGTKPNEWNNTTVTATPTLCGQPFISDVVTFVYGGNYSGYQLLGVYKIDNPDPVQAGEELTYTIIISNQGDALANVRLTETYPANTSFLSASPAPASGNNIWNFASLPAGNTFVTVTVEVHNDLPDGTILNNLVQIGSPTQVFYSYTEQTTVRSAPDLRIVKTAEVVNPPAQPGSLVNYSIYYENLGNRTASNVVINDIYNATYIDVDDAPEGNTSISGEITWTLSSLAPGVSGTINYTMKIKDNTALFPAGSTLISNNAAITSNLPDANFNDNLSSATVSVSILPDLSVTKVATPNPGETGEELTYTISVTNLGPANHPDGIITVTDLLPAGTTYKSSNPTGTYNTGEHSLTWTFSDPLNVDDLRIYSVTLEALDCNLIIDGLSNTVSVSSAKYSDANNSNNVFILETNVLDNSPPVLTLPTVAASYTADAGVCLAALSFTATATDNCGVASFAYSVGGTTITFPYNFPVGTTTVDVLVTDIHDNTDSGSFDVIVTDDENPVLTLPTVAASYTADAGVCLAALSFTATATDNCGVASFAYSVGGTTITFPYNFPVGTTTVDVLVTDIHDNTDSGSFDVIVTDDENPVLTLPTVAASYTADAGVCLAALSFTATATDNCGVASFAYSVGGTTITFPYNFPVGTTTVDVLVTDIHDNTDSGSFDVIVTDDENPVLTLPTVAASYTADAGVCLAALSFTATATDNCGVASFAYSVGGTTITFPYNFPVGTTTVDVLVTDIHDNTDSGSFDVIVTDDENPVLTLPTVAASYTADAGVCLAALSFTATATDNCGVASFAYSVGGTTITFPYNFPVGTTTVDVLVTDIHDNTDSGSFDVIVTDDENPVLTLPTVAASYTADAGVCLAALSFTATATDNCGVASFAYSVGGTTITFPYNFPVGTTTVDVLVTDIHDNTDSGSFDVIVTDDENPVLTLPTVAASYTADAGVCLAALSFTATATDNCGVASFAYSVGGTTITFPYNFPVGTTTVDVLVTDIHDNTDSGSFDVIVTDDENPVLTLPTVAASYTADAGVCLAALSFTATATDNCGVASFAYSVGGTTITFPYNFPVGTTTVDVLVTDIHDNTDSGSFDVIVTDDENPVLTLPTVAASYTADAGVCLAALSFTATATDNCGVASFAYSVGGTTITFPYNFPVGTTTVDVLVTDIHDNTDSGSFDVIVTDDENPVLTLPTVAASYTADAGVCLAALSFTATATDNCGVASFAYSVGGTTITFPYNFPVGTTTVDVLVTDIHDNTDSGSFDVIVTDDENPVLTLPTVAASYTADAGVCLAALSFTATATDNCGVASFAYSVGGTTITFPYNFPVGTTTVDVLVTDIHDNTDSGSFDVIVTDDENPVLTLPTVAASYTADAGVCLAALSFTATATDNCGVASFAYSVGGTTITFPYNFPVGTTTVDVLVTDIHDNTDSGSFDVIVTDDENPVLTLPTVAASYTADAGVCLAALSFTATATDNCGVASFAYSVGGTTITFPYNFPVGTTTVDVLVTDIHDNTDSGSFDVIVTDDENPVLTLPTVAASYTADAGVCLAALSFTATATDNCGVASFAYSVGGTTITFPYNFPVGTTTVDVLVTDIHDNTDSGSFDVIVTDDENPVLTLPTVAASYTADAGVCLAALSFTATATDNCGVASFAYSVGGTTITFPYNFPVGTTTVDVLVTDIHDNTDSGSFDVIVTDDENPVLTLPTVAASYTADAGVCLAALSFTATATDNCGVASFAYSVGGTTITFPYNFPVGTTTVDVLVTDIHDNTDSGSFDVIVTDDENPVLTLPTVAASYTADAGVCLAALSFTATATDNCGVASFAYSVGGTTITFPYNFPVGTTTVDVLVTDIHDNTDSGSFDVIVTDDENPVLTLPTVAASYTADAGVCLAALSFTATATDNCGVASFAYSVGGTTITFPYNFPVGTTTVDVLVTDIHDNTDSGSFDVIVTDDENPVLTLPTVAASYTADAGVCLAALSFTATATDNCGVASFAYSVGGTTITFPYNFPVGTTTVDVLVTDIHDNTDSGSFDVIVTDDENPVLTLPTVAASYTADAGVCLAALSFTATATDNCGVASFAYSVGGTTITFPYNFPVGTTTVDVLVTDIHDNTDSGSFDVIVTDDENPVLTLPTVAASYTADAGVCLAALSFTATATDNCGVASFAYSVGGTTITFPYNFPVGTTTVDVLVTDIHDNTDSGSFDVIVTDDENPVLTLPTVAASYTADAGVCLAALSFTATATDNCGVASFAYSVGGTTITFPYNFPVGTTTVDVLVTDIHDNTDSGSFDVIVTDDENPVLTLPTVAASYTADAGVCLAALSFTATATDNCGVASFAYSVGGTTITFPYNFPVGTTTVDVLVTDIHDNTDSGSFDVIVTDDENPVLTLPTVAASYTADAGVCLAALSFTATATDNCGVASFAYSVGGTTITFPYNFPVGTTTVDVLVTDIHDNTDSGSFDVIVTDDENPVLTLPTVAASYTADAGVCLAALSFTATATDNCGVASFAYSVGGTTITFPYNFPVGTTTVDVLVTDIHDNTDSGSFDVIVTDDENPVLTLPTVAASYTADAGVCLAALSFTATATDNCGVASFAYSVGGTTITFPYNFPVGTTTVDVLVTDIHDNTDSGSFDVIVTDDENPVLTLPTVAASYTADAGVCLAALSFTATATDNCGVASFAYSVGGTTITFPYNFPVGTTTVDVLVTDIHDNTDSGSFDVIVTDDENPVLTLPTVAASYTADAGVCLAALSFTATATDNCGVASFAYSVGGTTITFPYNFPVGTTTVDVLVTDIHDNTDSGSFDVIVTDDENPVLTLPTVAASYTADAGVCLAALSFTATATDNCGVASFAYSVGGTTITFPYNFPVGTTTVDVLVTDIHDNTDSGSFDVIVTDDENPVLTLPTVAASYTADAGVCLAALSFTATATDNCGVASFAYSVGGTTITFPYNFPVGTTTVDVLVTDIHDNTDSGSFDVIVTDDENPVLTLPTVAASYTADAGVCLAALSFTATATDNCGVASFAYSVGGTTITFPYNFPVGTTTVDVLVTDIHDNTDSGSFDVIVTDDENPVLTLPTVAASYTADAGVCLAALSFTATATDNCGVASFAYSVGGTTITFPYNFPVGTTTVDVLVTDIHDNTDSGFIRRDCY